MIKEQFIEFIKTNTSDENVSLLNYEQAIKFFNMQLNLGNIKDNFHVRLMYQLQKKMNTLYLNEIKNLLFFSYKKNIQIIFLKGIFTAADLYQDINCRKINDIDILIHENDLYSVCKFLENKGFKAYQKYPIKDKMINNHIEFFKKLDSSIFLLIEVHLNCTNPQDSYPTLTKFAWDNVKQINILGLSPLRMSNEDQFIHYILHFYQSCIHIFDYYLLNIPQKGSFRLQSLFDACLLAEKYDLDFDSILNKINLLNANLEFQFACNIINKICPNLIPLFCYKLKKKNVLHDFFHSDEFIFWLFLSNNFKIKYLKQLIHNKIALVVSKNKVINLKQKIIVYTIDKSMFKCKVTVYLKEMVGIKVEIDKNNLEILKKNYFVVHCIFSPSIKKDTIVEKYEIKFEDNNILQIDKPYDDKKSSIINYSLVEEEKKFSIYFDIDLPIKAYNFILLSCNIIFDKVTTYCLTGKNYIDLETMLLFGNNNFRNNLGKGQNIHCGLRRS